MRDLPDSSSERDISQFVYGRLHLMHHNFVGPKTAAEKLPSFFEDLTRSTRPSHLYAAGWVALEAALQSDTIDATRRTLFLKQAEEALEQAIVNATEFANHKAEMRNGYADYSYPYHIAATLAYAPLIGEIAHGGRPNRQTVQSCYGQLRHISELAAINIEQVASERPQGIGALIGLLNELNTLSIYNRVLSTQFVALPTIERADDGTKYRETTHDIQVLHLKGGQIVSRVPVEAKMTLSKGHSMRYEAILVGGDRHLRTHSTHAAIQLSRMLDREYVGAASQEEIATLDELTQNVFHLHRHYHRPEEIGRHCLNLERCAHR